MSTFKEDKIATRELEREESQAEIFYDWLHTPEGRPFAYTAAIGIIKNYYAGDDWDFKDLTESANLLVEQGKIGRLTQDRMESDYMRAKRESEEAETKLRAELVEYILTNRKMSAETREAESIRLKSKHTTLQTLQTIADNVKKARLSESELTTLAKEEEAQLQARRGIRPGRYMQIPEIYTHGPGGRSMLISLANTDLDEYKRILARCDPVEIQQILNKKERD